MKLPLILLLSLGLAVPAWAQVAEPAQYLAEVQKELTTVWPKNRTINLVFHGHSVPAGYWHDHEVHTLESYPNLVLKKLKEKYPYAVINVIVTAIGGENAVKGEARFAEQVLSHRPDVLFIDYALNDRFAGLDKASAAWESMVKQALDQQVKVVLLTPSPDQRLDLLDPANALEPHVQQIWALAAKYHTGLADPYERFREVARAGKLKAYMSHVNHPNEAGHAIIAEELLKWLVGP